jgi:N-acetylglutamate synthase-like GNAT family acetyltransferase
MSRSSFAASGLPITGVAEALCSFIVAESDGKLVGVVGLELCCEHALLRSTAVAPNWRARGLGRQLVERIIYRDVLDAPTGFVCQRLVIE